MELVFETLDKYLVPKKTQLLNVIVVGVGADEVSRRGEISVVALSTLNGVTWLMDTKTLGDLFWEKSKPYLSDPFIEKAFYDCRNFADYLLNVKGIELRGMYDVMVIEARERGRIPRVKELPKVEQTKQIDRDMFLGLKTMIDCYLGDETLACRDPLPPEEWASRTGGTRIPSPVSTAWLCDQQVFLARFINDKVDFKRALKSKRYIKWWVSSEYFSVLLAKKGVRQYDMAEKSLVIPRYVICGNTTEQPIGATQCVQCARLLPLREFPVSLERINTEPNVCLICLKILNKVIQMIDGKVHVKDVDPQNLKVPSHFRKSFRKRSGSMEARSGDEIISKDTKGKMKLKKKSTRRKSVAFS